MTNFGQDALKWCTELAELTETSGEIQRDYLSPSHRQIGDRIAFWLRDAGLESWRDAVGNQWGRLAAEDPNAPVVILGGYLDTPPKSGRFDGVLGLVLSLLVMKKLKSEGVRLPFHVDLVGFADDRSGRFSAQLLGSRAVAGCWEKHWPKLADGTGRSIAEAFAGFELDSAHAFRAARTGERIMAYLEANLEEGPILEAEELPIGIVSAISGTRRFVIDFEGQTGHAGTVPMHLRRDALVGAAEFALIVERIAQDHGVTATVGRITASPGVPQLIAGRAELTLDIRSEQDSERDAALDMIWETAKLACEERYIEMCWEETYVAPAVACADVLQSSLAQAIERQGLRPRYLVSGADHDAVAMAKLCPVALLSVRSTGGLNRPSQGEASVLDVDLAGRVLRDWIIHFPIR